MTHHPNILVVVLDTVRASTTYLADEPYTPTMASVASEGADFRHAITPAPWTLPTHASIYTGEYPTEHGATTHLSTLPESYTTLAEQLSNAGYRTAVASSNVFLTEAFGMTRGFDETSFLSDDIVFSDALNPNEFVHDRDHQTGLNRWVENAEAILSGNPVKNLINGVYWKYNDLFGADEEGSERWDPRHVDAATDFIADASSGDAPWFAMVNLTSAHAPWPADRDVLTAAGISPADIADWSRWEWAAEHSADQHAHAAGDLDLDDTDRDILTALYRAWTQRADALAGDLLQALDRQNVADDTVVVLTSDHGELVAENGHLGHSWVTDEQIAHVPLTMRGPGVPDTTIDSTVSLVDLHDTLRSLAGDEVESTLFDDAAQGRALCETDGLPADVAAETAPDYQHLAREYPPRRRLVTDDGSVERWGDGTTIGDESLLADLDAMLDSLHSTGSGDGSRADMSAVEERLDDLGYLQ